MNAPILERHRTRLADMAKANPGASSYDHALQLIANADAAARAFRYGGSVAPHMAALICPDDTVTEPKEGYTGAGDLDAGTPNHFDPTKRGFNP